MIKQKRGPLLYRMTVVHCLLSDNRVTFTLQHKCIWTETDTNHMSDSTEKDNAHL